jgi:hypothetical protein
MATFMRRDAWESRRIGSALPDKEYGKGEIVGLFLSLRRWPGICGIIHEC